MGNKKVAVIISVVVVVILVLVAVVLAFILSRRNATPDKSKAATQSLTKVGGRVYCIDQGKETFPLTEGKIVINSPVFGVKEVFVNQEGEWFDNLDWSHGGNKYEFKYVFDKAEGSLVNGVKFSALKNNKAVNCDNLANLRSSNPTNLACKVSSGVTSICSADKSYYSSCELNDAALDKAYGFKGFDFTFESCGNPVTTDLELKLTSTTIFVPGNDVSIKATLLNKSDKDLDFDKDAFGVSFSNLVLNLDNYKIKCEDSNGQTYVCGASNAFGPDSIGVRKLLKDKSLNILIEGKIKTKIKLLDKFSISAQVKMISGLVDTDKNNNTALIEKTIITDGTNCGDTKLVWSQEICWNNVKREENGTFNLYKSCGEKDCKQEVLKALNESEICMFNNWLKAGKPPVLSCNASELAGTTSSSTSSATKSITTSKQITPATSSSSSSSSSSNTSTTSSSRSSSTKSVVKDADDLPRTSVGLNLVIFSLALFLILSGFVSYKIYFSKQNYAYIYTEGEKVKNKLETNSALSFRKLKIETKLIISKLIYFIRKRF